MIKAASKKKTFGDREHNKLPRKRRSKCSNEDFIQGKNRQKNGFQKIKKKTSYIIQKIKSQ